MLNWIPPRFHFVSTLASWLWAGFLLASDFLERPGATIVQTGSKRSIKSNKKTIIMAYKKDKIQHRNSLIISIKWKRLHPMRLCLNLHVHKVHVAHLMFQEPSIANMMKIIANHAMTAIANRWNHSKADENNCEMDSNKRQISENHCNLMQSVERSMISIAKSMKNPLQNWCRPLQNPWNQGKFDQR